MISKITAIIMSVVALISNFSGILPSVAMYYPDVEYGTHKRQVMDVFFPQEYEKTEAVVLFIHGGGWVSGDKSSFKKRAQSISKTANCIAATMNYRFTSKSIDCNDMLDDITSALKKIESMAETRGIECERVMLAGNSAGAHLAMLYAYTKQGSSPIEVCAVTSYSGPPDLSSDSFVNGISGTSKERSDVIFSNLVGKDITTVSTSKRNRLLYKYSPIKYVTANTVPTLIVHGTNDGIVNVEDARALAKKLKANRVDYKYYELPDSGHGLNADAYILEQSNAEFVEFVNMYIK